MHKNILLDYIQHVTSVDVVEAALDRFATLVDKYGQIVVNDDAATMTALEKITTKLMKLQAPCQTIDPEDIPYVDTENGFGAGGFGGFGGFDGEDGEDDEDEEEEEEEDEEGGHVHGDNCNHGPHGHDNEADDVSVIEALFGVLGSLAKAKGASIQVNLGCGLATTHEVA